MILSDEHRFIFIHIPKTGGSHIRESARHLDDFKHHWPRHADLFAAERLMVCHATPAELCAKLPELAPRFRDYESVAILRDPVQRFVSALFQQLREFQGLRQAEIGADVLNREAERVIAEILRCNGEWHRGVIHMRPQVDFITGPEGWRASRLFRFEDLAAAHAWIGARLGIQIDDHAEAAVHNAAIGVRWDLLRPVVRHGAPLLRRIMPGRMDAVRHRLMDMGVFVRLGQSGVARGLDQAHHAFLAEYYAADLAVYHSIVPDAEPALVHD